eukprot:4762739-Lingulodinium_polyedra.AAC.1
MGECRQTEPGRAADEADRRPGPPLFPRLVRVAPSAVVGCIAGRGAPRRALCQHPHGRPGGYA